MHREDAPFSNLRSIIGSVFRKTSQLQMRITIITTIDHIIALQHGAV